MMIMMMRIEDTVTYRFSSFHLRHWLLPHKTVQNLSVSAMQLTQNEQLSDTRKKTKQQHKIIISDNKKFGYG